MPYKLVWVDDKKGQSALDKISELVKSEHFQYMRQQDKDLKDARIHVIYQNTQNNQALRTLLLKQVDPNHF